MIHNNILTKIEIISLPNSFKNHKELFHLFASKIGSDGGDFPRIIEIALLFFINYKIIGDLGLITFTPSLKPYLTISPYIVYQNFLVQPKCHVPD